MESHLGASSVPQTRNVSRRPFKKSLSGYVATQLLDEHLPLTLKPCQPDEFSKVLGFLDTCFSKPTRFWFKKNLTHIFDSDPALISNHLIVRSNNAMAGVIGMYPFTLTLGKVRLKVCGIGSVATHPDFRGQGIMSAMLGQVIDRMHTQGYDISWLSGDRYRYVNYGWDFGGSEHLYTIKKKDFFRRYPNLERARLRRCTGGDIDHLDSLHNSLPLRCVRQSCDWERHLKRVSVQFVTLPGQKTGAYLCASKDGSEIFELAGEPGSVCELLGAWFARSERDVIQVHYPLVANPISELLHSFCSNCSLTHRHQYRIVCADQLWKKVAPLIGGQHESGLSQLNSIAVADRTLVLERAFGFETTHPLFPRRLAQISWVKPLNWWLSVVDQV